MRFSSDRYDGITIDPITIPNSIEHFKSELQLIFDTTTDKKLLWIKIPIEKSHLIPTLTEHDFLFHHCNETELMLVKKLIPNPRPPDLTDFHLPPTSQLISNQFRDKSSR